MVQSLEKYPQGIDFQTDLLPSSSELSSDYYRRPVRGKRKVNKLSKCTQEKMVENEEKKKLCFTTAESNKNLNVLESISENVHFK